MSEPHTVRDLLPAFALGILDEEEKTEVTSHLARCASCREELASFRQVTGRMAAALPEAVPPAGLEQKILRAVHSSAAGQASPRRATRQLSGARSRRTPWQSLTGIAAAVAVVLAAGNLLQWTGVIAPNRHAPGSRLTTATLLGVGPARSAYGTIVLDPKDNEGVLAVTGLPGLDTRHQYQLWLVRDGERRSAGVFSPDREGYGSMLIAVPADFKDFQAFGVSVEPWGGSPAPTGARVLSGRF